MPFRCRTWSVANRECFRRDYGGRACISFGGGGVGRRGRWRGRRSFVCSPVGRGGGLPAGDAHAVDLWLMILGGIRCDAVELFLDAKRLYCFECVGERLHFGVMI